MVIDGHTGLADAAATEAQRAEIRAQRLARAKPYAEFVAEWSKLTPPAEILRYYGPWEGAAA
ncbi:hypothetical protein D3C72_2309030 [compost metagenome]